MTLLFEKQFLFIHFIAADRIERCVLFNNMCHMSKDWLQIDQSMFHYIDIMPISIVDYWSWSRHIDRIQNSHQGRTPDLTLAMAMYMKKMGIPAVKPDLLPDC